MGCCDQRAPRVEVVTLGCKVNQAESREIMAGLGRCGYRAAAHWERPDIVIVNTCAVTSVSEAKGRKEIGRALRRGAKGLVVTGCMAEVSEAEIAAIAGVDLVVTRKDKPRLLEMIQAALPSKHAGEREQGPGGEGASEPGPERARAFVKVQDGCDRRCSYCIVPRARGGSFSLRACEIRDQVKEAVERGAREIVLCGINLGGWSGENGEGLTRLVEEVLSTGEDFRVRLSSLDPEDVNCSLFEGLRRLRRLCPHFHLPLQSGSEKILKKMGRGYRPEDYQERIEELRSFWEGPAVTTDVMVGFPGETEEDFTETLRLVEMLKPSRLHVFRYSRRPGTEAAEMTGQVPEGEKRGRAAMLSSMGKELALEYSRVQEGKMLEVLAEKMEDGRDGLRASGITENYLRAELRGDGMAAGGLFKGTVIGTNGPGVVMVR